MTFSDAFSVGALEVKVNLYGSNIRYFKTSLMGAQWLSGRVLDLRPKGQGFEPDRRHCVVYLSKTHLSLLSTGSTQEDPTRHN